MDAQTHPNGVLEEAEKDTNKMANLLKLGVSNSNAGILANSRKGYWRIAGSPIMNTALSNARLEKAGFRSFSSYYKSVCA